jgi:cysteine-rich repeat protein
VPGLKSLTTEAADTFWRERENELPKNTLYTSFRCAITDPHSNLPDTNKGFFVLLKNQQADHMGNDMQVRLFNQSLKGAIADREVMLPAAEGNHWQWELNPGAVAENVMPEEMVTRTPQPELFLAYFETLHDIGLFGMHLTVSSTCGDGKIDPGEECDDGNTMSGDGCSATCTNEGGSPDMAGTPDMGAARANPDMAEASNGDPLPSPHSDPRVIPTPKKVGGCDFTGDLAGSALPMSLLLVSALLLGRGKKKFLP